MGEFESNLYKSKLISAERAAELVKSGDVVHYSEFVLFPETLDAALARRIGDLHDVTIRSTCFMRVPEVIKADPAREHFIMEDYHFGTFSRRLHDRNMCNYIPITYHLGPRMLKKYVDVDVYFLSAGAMDSRGYFNFGLSNSVSSAVISKAKKIVVEVNDKIPYCLGGNQESLHISRVDYIWKAKASPSWRFRLRCRRR